jgi:hypothetical protein
MMPTLTMDVARSRFYDAYLDFHGPVRIQGGAQMTKREIYG